jgi:hypothetical protein
VNKPSTKTHIPEAVPSFMKAFVLFLLLLIPCLGFIILRSDPIIHSNNIEKSEQAMVQVRAFAAFIEKKPELAHPIAEQRKLNVSAVASSPAALSADQVAARTQARELVADLTDFWAQHPAQFDEVWKAQVNKLFDVIEQSGSEGALDLVQSQVLLARNHSDDLIREQSDRWLTRYLSLEHRESKIREMSDFFKEKVLDRVDQDERKMRENQSR